MKRCCGIVVTVAITYLISGVGIFAQDIAPERPQRSTVYKSDFDKEFDQEIWGTPRKGILGDTKYHGPFFGYAWGRFELPDLKPHQFVRIKAELIVSGTLNGGHPESGGDNWGIASDSGGLLFLTSFLTSPNGIPADPLARQAFPDEVFAGSHQAGTGAKESNTKELVVDSPKAAKFANADATYELDFTFPHDHDSLYLCFYTFFDTVKLEEMWAFRSFEVEIISGPEPREPAELEKLWKALSGEDAVAAHRAVWDLAASGKPGLDYAEAQWAQRNGFKDEADLAAQFAAQVKLLDSDAFVERASARSKIFKFGEAVIPLINAAMEKPGTSPEIKHGLAGILKKFSPPEDKKPDVVEGRLKHLRRLFSRHGQDYITTASSYTRPPQSAKDGVWPKLSSELNLPRFTYWQKKGTTEWLQYEFPDKRSVTAAEVFWVIDGWDGGMKLPAAWRIKWRDEKGVFHEVKPKGAYGIEVDKFNRIEFDAVETTAIRLEIDLTKTNAAGLHEFRLDDKPVR